MFHQYNPLRELRRLSTKLLGRKFNRLFSWDSYNPVQKRSTINTVPDLNEKKELRVRAGIRNGSCSNKTHDAHL